MRLTLPTDSAERKEIPIRSGCIDYFPAAIAGVAKHSVAGNNKHNPGQPLHHARGKSTDHTDCIDRHLTDIADMLAALDRAGNCAFEPEGILAEANALCWRALALSQELHERFGAPLAPRARLPEPVKGLQLDWFVQAAQTPPVASLPTDFLGRRLREYSPEARLHHPWCGLDTDHVGECQRGFNPVYAGQATSESQCSGQQCAESHRTPAEYPPSGPARSY